MDHYTAIQWLVGTLAIDGWAVTFGTARRGLCGLWPHPSLYQMYVTKVKVKVWTLVIAPLTWVRLVTSSISTISEVAADWHEPMLPQRILWPFIAHANGQLDWTHGAASRHTIAPTSHTRPSPCSCCCSYYSFISRPTEGRRLSWPELTVG